MLRNTVLGKKCLQIHSVSIDTNNTSISKTLLSTVSQEKKIAITTHCIPQWVSHRCSTYLSDNSADKQASSSIQFDKIKWNHYNLRISHFNKDWFSQQIIVQQERVTFWKTFCTYFTTKLSFTFFYLEEYFTCTKSSCQERFSHKTLKSCFVSKITKKIF